MVNCGGAHSPLNGDEENIVSPDSEWVKNSTITALCEAFPGKVNCSSI